jgi:hypothetical protein
MRGLLISEGIDNVKKKKKDYIYIFLILFSFKLKKIK